MDHNKTPITEGFSLSDYEYLSQDLKAVSRLIEAMGAWFKIFEIDEESATPLYMMSDMISQSAQKVETLFNEVVKLTEERSHEIR